MRILILAGSVREESKSSALARAVASAADDGMTVDLFPPLDVLPHFNPKYGDSETPSGVVDLRARIAASNAVVVVTPEYAHGAPGVLKNALDWLVGSGELMGMPVAVISSSPSVTGGSMAQLSLVATVTVMGGQLVDTVTVPFVGTKLDEHGTLADKATQARIRAVVELLGETAGQRPGVM